VLVGCRPAERGCRIFEPQAWRAGLLRFTIDVSS
jgi:hypothetical protein